MANPRPPKLPKLLDRKIYKTGQTRGADDDEIFQNRVSRTSTALIPLQIWITHFHNQINPSYFENGYIVLLSPDIYFESYQGSPDALNNIGLSLGTNALLFYETRQQWLNFPPENYNWVPATSRTSPLNGQFVARISATTALNEGAKINHGFTTTANKGAGIRVYEYANALALQHCRWQLEAVFWLCSDSRQVAIDNGMTEAQAIAREAHILGLAEENGLLDFDSLRGMRIVNEQHHAICPLCLEPLGASGFFSRMEQAEGREVLDLTITQLNLFHIEELRMGVFNHRPYNLGWGHHHCNVVVKDAGIDATLEWMKIVLQRNIAAGYIPPLNNES